MKKWLATLLAMALALSLAAPALAVEPEVETGEDAYLEMDGEAVDLIDLEDLEDIPWIYPDPEAEPTYTLVVNGQATDVELTVTDWVTYADGEALGPILGTELDRGPVALRTAAQAAGWDVVWYGGSWWDNAQEICLFDKGSYEADFAARFGPCLDFLAQVMDQSKALLYADTPQKLTETVDVTLTRFSTLDGDRTYTARFNVETLCGGGVMDCTVTFDLRELLKALDVETLLAGSAGEDFDLARLTALLQGGKAELLVDWNQGTLAFHVPLLALVDEDLAGWQRVELADLGVDLQTAMDLDLAGLCYGRLLERADWSGGVSAQEEYDTMVSAMEVYLGADCFTTQRGRTTWTVTTDRVNAALAALMEAEGETPVSAFRRYEISMTLDDRGQLEMSMDVRPDMDGIAAALADEAEEAVAAKLLLSLVDFQITAGASGTGGNGTEWMELHWNNQGKLRLEETATQQAAAAQPRTPASVDGRDLLGSLGLMGGADGPTTVFLG